MVQILRPVLARTFRAKRVVTNQVELRKLQVDAGHRNRITEHTKETHSKRMNEAVTRLALDLISP
jgi:hypothetical protein